MKRASGNHSMKTAIGAPDPGDWDRGQPHNIFNDRRVGGRAKNRAVGESYNIPKKILKEPNPYKGRNPK